MVLLVHRYLHFVCEDRDTHSAWIFKLRVQKLIERRGIQILCAKIVMLTVQRYTHFMCKGRDTHKAEVFIVLFVCLFVYCFVVCCIATVFSFKF